MNQVPDSGENLKTMSFGDHLEELRGRVLRSILVVLFCAAIAFIFQNELMQLVTGPHRLALSQIEASTQIWQIHEDVTSARSSLQVLPAEQAKQVLLEADQQQDWWSRWNQFRQQQTEAGVNTDLVELLEERISDLDRATSSSLVLGGTATRFQTSADQLRVILNDAPWGTSSPIEETIGELEAMSKLLIDWGKISPTTTDPVESSESDEPGEPETDPNPAPTLVDAGVVEVLEEVAALSVTVESRSRDLIGWRSKALPLALLSYAEAFFAYVKLSLLIGLLCALPWLTFEIWQFIAAGLYRTERRAAVPFLPVAFLLLAMGVTFAYLVLIPVGLSFLGGYGDPQLVRPVFTLKNYLGLVFTLILGMGLVFQLPLLMIFLTRSGLLNVDNFRHYRKYSIVGAVILGALLTPPDIVTQLLMAGPLVILYEVGIIACAMSAKKKSGDI
ncbi:MAG: twin-arginine translocase subunit TatC [Planctomycetota bacterium]